MGNHHGGVVRAAQPVHAVGHNAQGINVQAGVGFVQQGQRGFQQGHLQHFVALLFAAGKAFVHGTAHQFRVDFHFGDFAPQQAVELPRAHFLLAPVDAAGVHGRLEELPGADAGQFYGVLEGQKDAFPGPVLRLHSQQVQPPVGGLPARDFVLRPAGQGIGQGAFAGAVGAHYGVDFAGAHGEVDALQNLLFVNGHAQVAHFQNGAIGCLRSGCGHRSFRHSPVPPSKSASAVMCRPAG